MSEPSAGAMREAARSIVEKRRKSFIDRGEPKKHTATRVVPPAAMPMSAMLPREEERDGKQENAERSIQAAERRDTEIQ